MSSPPQAPDSGPTDSAPARGLAATELEAIVRRIAIDSVTAEVVGAFERNAIPSILLKGPALVRWLYPKGHGRSYCDSDLLVPYAELSRAESVLRSMGFERLGRETIPGDWPRHAHNWLRPDGAVIDLHFTLPGAQAPPQEVWRIVAERIEPMVVANRRVHILDPGARALLVALHALKDGGRMPQARRDLVLALERLPIEVWENAASLATRIGAVGPFAAGLEREPSGSELARRLRLPSGRSTATLLRMRGAPPLAVGMDWLFGTPGWRRKALLVVRKIFPPASFLRDWSPLARRGRLGLAAAYVWRLVWVMVNAGPAFRAWLRARREAGRPPPDPS
jgi:putative nucleotidyltransferase-like protein